MESLWESTWEFLMFNKTLSRNRLRKIVQFLYFIMKSDRRQRVINDKFYLVSLLRNSFY